VYASALTGFFQGGKGPGIQGDAPEEARNTVEALKAVADEILKLKTPTGKRDAPGVTCKDIAMANPEARTGYYWINPNGGRISDSIRVFCKMSAEKSQTCLESVQEQFETTRREFTKQENGVWSFAASFIEKEEFDYNTHKSQIKMLQHHISNGRQRVTVKCRDTVVILDKASGSYDKAVTLTSFDEETLGAQLSKPFKFKVLKDGCQRINGELGETVLEVSGDKMVRRLPILDVGFPEHTAGEFGIKLGRACFWEKSGGKKKKRRK